MGYLLKEALKTMCGVNQWCYAVFWKIGCQNPKLLIWEECYYDPIPSPQRQSGEGCLATLGPHCNGQKVGSNIEFLVDKMMIKNQINIIGEGIIGRAAFTGNYQWILSNIYDKNMHPPEVLNEMHHQFSAGIQTVAIIPVMPHGVVQLGSSLLIAENRGFVNDVRSLILQLGCVPGALFSETYTARKGLSNSLLTPVMDLSQNSKATAPNSPMTDYSKQLSASSFTLRSADQPYHSLIQHIHMNPRITDSAVQTFHPSLPLIESHGYNCHSGATPSAKASLPHGGRLDSRVVAEVIPSKLDVLNQLNTRRKMDIEAGLSKSGGCSSTLTHARDTFPEVLASNLDNSSSSTSNNYFGVPLRMNLDGANDLYSTMSGHPMTASTPPSLTNTITSLADLDNAIFQDGNSSVKLEEFPLSSVRENTPGNMLLGASTQLDHLADVKDTDVKLESGKQSLENDAAVSLSTLLKVPKKMNSVTSEAQHRERCDSESQCTISTNVKYEEASGPHCSGDDLYDILGVDFKNKLLSGKFNQGATVGLRANSQCMGKEVTSSINTQEARSDIYSVSGYLPESSIHSGTSGDHLLEAVVSGAQSASKQCSDDDISCKTTLTKISSSAMPGISEQVQPKAFGMPKPIPVGGNMAAYSFKSSCSKGGTCSESGSFCGSQISSWVEHAVKQENSVSTACSKRPDDLPKSNRKRLKPGENPRPRPKDRQMIQDRVKELREIVPNGAKCSIDALLERTIKHMLFLQSVTKHADKLKQTGESKILSEEDGLLSKDNFEGGATWAYEVGSQSMTCPIIVEDLNSPGQKLVEMLCEDRGFFLEIADIIRGLGLTILKGVMEARNDKVWAQFVVEANRDISRVDVFMSLVHLLDQTVKSSSMPANIVDTDMMAHHSVAQAATIRATGMANNLQ